MSIKRINVVFIILLLGYNLKSKAETIKSELNYSSLATALKAKIDTDKKYEILKTESIGIFTLGLSEKDLERKIHRPLKLGKQEFLQGLKLYSQDWKYPEYGISFSMYSENRGDIKTLGEIIIEKPSTLKTRKGIHIGSSEDEVHKVYKNGQYINNLLIPNSQYVVANDPYYGATLTFAFDKGKVMLIRLAADWY